jgi:hypothetical protein
MRPCTGMTRSCYVMIKNIYYTKEFENGCERQRCQNMRKTYNEVLKHWNKFLGVLSTFVMSIKI